MVERISDAVADTAPAVREMMSRHAGFKDTGTRSAGHDDGSDWKPGRLWNGDEADNGIFFSSPGAILHVTLGTY